MNIIYDHLTLDFFFVFFLICLLAGDDGDLARLPAIGEELDCSIALLLSVEFALLYIESCVALWLSAEFAVFFRVPCFTNVIRGYLALLLFLIYWLFFAVFSLRPSSVSAVPVSSSRLVCAAGSSWLLSVDGASRRAFLRGQSLKKWDGELQCLHVWIWPLCHTPALYTPTRKMDGMACRTSIDTIRVPVSMWVPS